MKALALAFFLPALAIFGATFVQYVLTLVWPQIQHLPSAVMSIDSYLVNLLTAALCFFAGRWIRRNSASRAEAALMTFAPLAFLTLILIAITRGTGSIAWFKPFTIFMLVTAVVPLLSVSLGWWRGTMADAAPR